MGSAPYLGGGFGHFYAYAPIKIEYAIDRFAMEVKRQLDVLDRRLAESEYLAGDDYTIADIAVWPWYGGLAKGQLYGAGEFLQVQDYKHVQRWTDPIAAAPGGAARPHGQPRLRRAVQPAARAPRRQRLRDPDAGQADPGRLTGVADGDDAGTASMTDRRLIVPRRMERIVATAGYVPAVQVGFLVFCAGQVGRDANLNVVADPEAQFAACWENLRLVLDEAGCTFHDVVDMTTYLVRLGEHLAIFRAVKDRVFPRGTCAWTVIGVTELAHPGLLAEVKCVAVRRSAVPA